MSVWAGCTQVYKYVGRQADVSFGFIGFIWIVHFLRALDLLIAVGKLGDFLQT